MQISVGEISDKSKDQLHETVFGNTCKKADRYSREPMQISVGEITGIYHILLLNVTLTIMPASPCMVKGFSFIAS